MTWKFSKTTITLEGRALGRNPFRLFITLIYSIEWDINELKRKVSPRVVPSLDIFIWFDTVWQALQEYEYQKKFWSSFQYKTWRKLERPIKIPCILHKREYAELSITSADRLFRLFGKLGRVIFSFSMWHCISKHKLIIDQLQLLKVKRTL